MGQQISCHSFYCQDVDYKPDWLSTSHYSFSSSDTQFQMERGLLQILPSPYIDLSISKEIHLTNISEFIIPLHFKISYPKPFHLTLSLSSYFTILFIFNGNHIQIQQNDLTILSGKIKQNVSYKILFKFIQYKENEWKVFFEFGRGEKKMMQREWGSVLLLDICPFSISFDNNKEAFLSDHHFSLSLE